MNVESKVSRRNSLRAVVWAVLLACAPVVAFAEESYTIGTENTPDGITLTSDPVAVKSGQTTDVTVTAKDGNGKAIVGMPLFLISQAPAGKDKITILVDLTATTDKDGNGKFKVTLPATPPANTTVKVSAPLPPPPAIFAFRGGRATVRAERNKEIFEDLTDKIHWGGSSDAKGFDQTCEAMLRQAFGLLDDHGKPKEVPEEQLIRGPAPDTKTRGTAQKAVGLKSADGNYRAYNIDIAPYNWVFDQFAVLITEQKLAKEQPLGFYTCGHGEAGTLMLGVRDQTIQKTKTEHFMGFASRWRKAATNTDYTNGTNKHPPGGSPSAYTPKLTLPANPVNADRAALFRQPDSGGEDPGTEQEPGVDDRSRSPA